MKITFVFLIVFCNTAYTQYKLLLNAGKFSSMSQYQRFEIADVIDVRADKGFNPPEDVVISAIGQM
jgi:hypothetical protein